MTIQKWFERELELIDPRYFVAYNQEYDYYEIKVRLSFSRTINLPGGYTSDGRGLRVITPDKQIHVRITNPTVAVCDGLDSRILEELKKRKWIGRNQNQDELSDVIKRNKEAKQLRKEKEYERIAEGFMKMHKMETSQTFDMATITS